VIFDCIAPTHKRHKGGRVVNGWRKQKKKKKKELELLSPPPYGADTMDRYPAQ
jgi:hypothetical protein